jgi:hypothetical protein
MLYSAADVVKYPRYCQILLPASTFPVAANIESQRRNPGFSETSRQASVETTFVACNSPTVNEHSRIR